jgi:hypothetical protein
MTATLTSPDVQLTMTMHLQQLFTQQPYTPIPSIPGNVQAALKTQDSIGWENFFKGCIAQDWRLFRMLISGVAIHRKRVVDGQLH